MRPLLALILLVALLVGGLFWLGGSRSGGALGPKAAEAPALPQPSAPEAELSSADAGADKLERAAQPAAAVHLEDSTAAKQDAAGLIGRVVGADGRPVSGAKVYAGPADEFAFMPLDAVDTKNMPWVKRADGLTDAEGRFALSLSGQTHVRLAVRASGFAPLNAERTLARGERDLGDVALEPGVVLEGRVIDQVGRPVAEAQLFARPRSSGFGIEMMGRGRVPLATTDAEGRFKVDMLASGPWRMLVGSEDHPDKTFDGETDRPGARVGNLVFALEEGAQIAGRVTGAAGDVLAKLQVSAQQRNENDEGGAEMVFGPGGFSQPRRAKVGADGSFLLRGLKPNQGYRLDAQKSDNGPMGYGYGGRGGVSAKSGDRGIEVPYKPGPAIVCQVVDAASGKPLTELDVKAGYGWSMPLMDADGKPKTSFPDGNVRFDRLPPRFGGNGGGLKLRIDATGYKSYESPELTAVDGQDIDLGVLRLERAPVCRVQVLDSATGQPIAGADVSLHEDSGDEQSNVFRSVQINRRGGSGRTVNDQGQSQGTTNAQGEVVLSSFPGKQARLKVKHDDYAPWNSGPITLASGGDHQETVKLARGGEVLVTVQDSKGQPVAGVEVEHSAEGDEPSNAWMRRFSGEGSTRTDARGEVSFAHLPAGTHRFRVAGGGGPMVFGGGGGSVRASFVVQGGQAESPQEEPWSSVEVLEGAQAPLKLLAPMRATLTGRVREGGKALAGASVHLEEQRSGERGLAGLPAFFGGGDGPRTNGSGEYKQEGIKPGKYSVRVTHPSRAMPWETDLEVVEGEQRFDIDLPIAIAEGRVTGPDGKPIAGARVTAERAKEKTEESQMVFSIAMAGNDGDVMTFGGSGGGEAQRTDSDGRYTLRGLLTDADLVVHVSGKDFTPANSEKFRCAPDQTVRGIDVQVKQGGALEVHVTRAGQAASGVLVNAYRKGKDGTDADQQTQVTGPGGLARFSGLEPGEWEYSVSDFSNPDNNPEPRESARKPVAISAGQTQKVENPLP